MQLILGMISSVPSSSYGFSSIISEMKASAFSIAATSLEQLCVPLVSTKLKFSLALAIKTLEWLMDINSSSTLCINMTGHLTFCTLSATSSSLHISYSISNLAVSLTTLLSLATSSLAIILGIFYISPTVCVLTSSTHSVLRLAKGESATTKSTLQ